MSRHFLRHAEIEDVEGFLLECLVVGLVDQRSVEFLDDFPLKTFFNDCTRSLAGAESGDPSLGGITSGDLSVLTVNSIHGDFHAQGGDALWLLLDNNVHNKWDRRRRRGGEPSGKPRRLSNEACNL